MTLQASVFAVSTAKINALEAIGSIQGTTELSEKDDTNGLGQ